MRLDVGGFHIRTILEEAVEKKEVVWFKQNGDTVCFLALSADGTIIFTGPWGCSEYRHNRILIQKGTVSIDNIVFNRSFPILEFDEIGEMDSKIGNHVSILQAASETLYMSWPDILTEKPNTTLNIGKHSLHLHWGINSLQKCLFGPTNTNSALDELVFVVCYNYSFERNNKSVNLEYDNLFACHTFDLDYLEVSTSFILKEGDTFEVAPETQVSRFNEDTDYVTLTKIFTGYSCAEIEITSKYKTHDIIWLDSNNITSILINNQKVEIDNKKVQLKKKQFHEMISPSLRLWHDDSW